MRLTKITCHSFTVQFKQHAPRQVAILTLHSESGVSHAEIAPYPGLSKETLKQAVSQLAQKEPFLLQTDWSMDQLQKLDALNLYPSLQFALESALLSLLDPLDDFTCTLCALIQGSLSDLYYQAEEAIKKGYPALKVKISGLTVDGALSFIRTFAPHARLRLDMNRRYAQQQTFALISQLSIDDVDYIEEPLQEVEGLKTFPFPFALDETLRDHDVKHFLDNPHLKALVIKPTLMGGYSAIRTLKSLSIPLILSCCYESGLGLLHIASLGKRLGLLTHPSGLDTYRLIQNDLIDPPLQINQPYLTILKTYALPHLSVQTIAS